ncbi:MAG: heat-shock protein Hsp20 [Gemmatimonadetes bacterium]|nr:heat-shock protein Hsp20 [Gemmatimonadota bacterium]
MTLATRTPRTPALRNDFDRFFADLWDAPFHSLATHRTSLPRTDVIEDAEAHRVVVEVPGFDEKSVEVTVEDGLLTIRGEMEARAEDEGSTYHRLERQQGAFTRTFRLPDGIDAEGATAEFYNGLLEVRIPKSEKSKPRALSITRR